MTTGYVVENTGGVDSAAMFSASIGTAWLVDWRQDLYSSHSLAVDIINVSIFTNTAPITMVSWSGTGFLCPDDLAGLKNCLAILTHI